MAAPDQRGGGRRARREEVPERSFQWVVPRGRKASVYEDITLDTQPSVHRFMANGYFVSFPDGRGTWDDASTALDVAGWSAFRDPSELWERPYYQQGAQCEKEIEASVRGARAEGLLADIDPEWVAFLRRDGQVPAFIEHGIWSIATRRSRAALSDVLTHVIVLYAAMKQRQAQAFVIEGMDLDEDFGDVTIEAAKARWVNAAAWQPTRACVERLGTITDWGELIYVSGMIVEPLLGAMVRRELLLRPALAAGDPITPVIVRNAQREWGWWRDLSLAFTQFVLTDAQHGSANRELVGRWQSEWEPVVMAGVDALEPIFAAAPRADFDRGRATVRADHEALRAAAGLTAEEAVV
jgi:propane monooxygenase small subunit